MTKSGPVAHPKPPVKLYHFRRRAGLKNFGDDISPVVTEFALGRPVQFEEINKCELISIGSLYEAGARARYRGFLKGRFATLSVWGSGTLRDGGVFPALGINNIAVRGEKTRARIIPNRNIAVGDPALLLRWMFPVRGQKRYRVCFIPHFADDKDTEFARLLSGDPRAVLGRIDGDWQELINTVKQSNLVVSSSLHGLIAADAFGVPSVWAEVSDKVIGGGWKFRDYYSIFSSPPPGPVDLSSIEKTDELFKLASVRSGGEVEAICENLVESLKNGL